MESEFEDSRIFKAFIFSSLEHMATVQVAIELFEDIDLITLQVAFKDIKAGKVNELSGDNKLPLLPTKQKKAQEKLLSIPPSLRKRVMEAVQGLTNASRTWRDNQYSTLKSEENNFKFHWRSDGRVDGEKTAHHFVLNPSNDIGKRFRLACKYCFEESIKTLWPEFEASGEADNSAKNRNCMVLFWIGRMRDGSAVPYREHLRNFLRDKIRCTNTPRFCLFFPLISTGEKKNLNFFFQRTDEEDYLSCLSFMTEKEQREILKYYPLKLLKITLEWPFRSRFVETVNKLWTYINEECFRELMLLFIRKERAFKDFGHYELFKDFWNNTPIHFREMIKRHPCFSEKISSYFNEIRKEEEFISMNKQKKALVCGGIEEKD